LKSAEKTTIVISGINMTNSGILSILDDCLLFLSKYTEGKNIRIIALVPSKSLVTDICDVEYLEFPQSKKLWIFRLYYEFFHFKKLSEKLNADIWFSLHDLSPRVIAKRKFVYCHNPSPFFKPGWKDWRYAFKICFFSVFYKYAYRFNIKSNTAVIVQQHWIQNAFSKMYGISNVITAYPEIHPEPSVKAADLDKNKIHFFYPAFPRTFKNFEAICEAVEMLPQETRNKIQVHLTLEKSNNGYAKYLVNHYGKNPEIKFIGIISREKVSEYYNACDVLVFPSKLETWGLPMTEFKNYGKTIFAADLPYAHETIGDYEKAYYFDPQNPQSLSRLMDGFEHGDLPKPVRQHVPPPDFRSWNSLFDYIFEGIKS
jgi:glycosyltransferase involved in cell wall biosynthesis